MTERELAAKLVDEGATLVLYMGKTFEVVDHNDGWIYVFEGREFTSLEQVLDAIEEE